jgi:hypothetical protein
VFQFTMTSKSAYFLKAQTLKSKLKLKDDSEKSRSYVLKSTDSRIAKSKVSLEN